MQVDAERRQVLGQAGGGTRVLALQLPTRAAPLWYWRSSSLTRPGNRRSASSLTTRAAIPSVRVTSCFRAIVLTLTKIGNEIKGRSKPTFQNSSVQYARLTNSDWR